MRRHSTCLSCLTPKTKRTKPGLRGSILPCMVSSHAGEKVQMMNMPALWMWLGYAWTLGSGSVVLDVCVLQLDGRSILGVLTVTSNTLRPLPKRVHMQCARSNVHSRIGNFTVILLVITHLSQLQLVLTHVYHSALCWSHLLGFVEAASETAPVRLCTTVRSTPPGRYLRQLRIS